MARPEPYPTVVSAPQPCLGFESIMSIAVHDFLKDSQFRNGDPGIEGNFPLDAAVIESEAPSTLAAPKLKNIKYLIDISDRTTTRNESDRSG